MSEVTIKPYHIKQATAKSYAMKIGAKHTIFVPKSVVVSIGLENTVTIKEWWYNKNINDLKEFRL